MLISQLLRSFVKARAVSAYTRKLPAVLSKHYGYAHSYTPQQVRRAVETAALNREFSCYAVAIFSSRETFEQFHRGLGETCDYDAMRAYIADMHFHGDASFSVPDVFAISSGSVEGLAHNGGHEVAHGGHSGGHGHH